jgi:hypothetical protein
LIEFGGLMVIPLGFEHAAALQTKKAGFKTQLPAVV